jgi:hypothetical protein
MMRQGVELVSQPLTIQNKQDICEAFFGSKACYDSEQLEAYFCYYKRQCFHLVQLILMNGNDVDLPIYQHAGILSIIQDIRAKVPHADIKANLLAKTEHQVVSSEQHIDYAIDLVLRLWLMLEVGTWEFVFTGRDSLTWTKGTIDDFVTEVPIFQGKPRMKCDGVKLEPHFTVKGLERIAGLQVRLTTNLADHLLLKADREFVFIFHHAAFLRRCEGYVI